MDQLQRPKNIRVTAAMRDAIRYALDLAFEDQDHYLRQGNPILDYGREWEEVKQLKAGRYRDLANLGEKLALEGEAERWRRLAEEIQRQSVTR